MKEFLNRIVSGIGQGIGIGIVLLTGILIFAHIQNQPTGYPKEKIEVPVYNITVKPLPSKILTGGVTANYIEVTFSVKREESKSVTSLDCNFEFFDSDGDFLFEDDEYSIQVIKTSEVDYKSFRLRVPEHIDPGMVKTCRVHVSAEKPKTNK